MDPKSTLPKAVAQKLWRPPITSRRPWRVVHVARDAPVELSIAMDRLPLTAADPARVADLAGAYGVTSSIARLQKALDGLPD